MPSREKSPEYKPLTFSTTVRNPSRIKEALNIISKFEGQILTNALSIEIFKNVIKEKKYQVMSAWRNPITRHLKSKYSTYLTQYHHLLFDYIILFYNDYTPQQKGPF